MHEIFLADLIYIYFVYFVYYTAEGAEIGRTPGNVVGVLAMCWDWDWYKGCGEVKCKETGNHAFMAALGMKEPNQNCSNYGKRCDCGRFDPDGKPFCRLDFRVQRGTMLLVDLVVDGTDRRSVVPHSVRYADSKEYVKGRWRCDECEWHIPSSSEYDRHSIISGGRGGGGGNNNNNGNTNDEIRSAAHSNY